MTYPYDAGVDLDAHARQAVAAERAQRYAGIRHACRLEALRYLAGSGPVLTDAQRRYLLGSMAGLAEAARQIAPSDPSILPPWFSAEATRLGV